jgi:hypothetical protein
MTFRHVCSNFAATCPRRHRVQFLLATLVISALCGVRVASAQAASRGGAAPRAIAPGPLLTRAADAVVTVVASREGTNEVTSGIGVRVPDGRVVTALRPLRGAVRVEVFNADGDLLGTVTTLDQVETKLDLGVLGQLTGSGVRIPFARRSASLAQKVSLLGLRNGTARSITARTITHVEPDDSGRPRLRLGVPVLAAASGAPVVNQRGELIAIAVGSIPSRDDNDVAVDVTAVRELLSRPVAHLSLPAPDGTIVAARAPTPDTKAASPVSTSVRVAEAARTRSSIFPDRYGASIGADTAGTWAVELFGCARLESRQKVYCYLRITNLARRATFAVAGGDLTDSTRRKLRSAENLIVGEETQRVSGWRTKGQVPLRELESARVALEFAPVEGDGAAVRLMIDVAGERVIWFGPFVLQRAH